MSHSFSSSDSSSSSSSGDSITEVIDLLSDPESPECLTPAQGPTPTTASSLSPSLSSCVTFTNNTNNSNTTFALPENVQQQNLQQQHQHYQNQNLARSQAAPAPAPVQHLTTSLCTVCQQLRPVVDMTLFQPNLPVCFECQKFYNTSKLTQASHRCTCANPLAPNYLSCQLCRYARYAQHDVAGTMVQMGNSMTPSMAPSRVFGTHSRTATGGQLKAPVAQRIVRSFSVDATKSGAINTISLGPSSTGAITGVSSSSFPPKSGANSKVATIIPGGYSSAGQALNATSIASIAPKGGSQAQVAQVAPYQVRYTPTSAGSGASSGSGIIRMAPSGKSSAQVSAPKTSSSGSASLVLPRAGLTFASNSWPVGGASRPGMALPNSLPNGTIYLLTTNRGARNVTASPSGAQQQQTSGGQPQKAGFPGAFVLSFGPQGPVPSPVDSSRLQAGNRTLIFRPATPISRMHTATTTATVSSAGAQQSGAQQSGTQQSGSQQNGTQQSGSQQSGSQQSGSQQHGSQQSGAQQSGSQQSGSQQSGTQQSGAQQSNPQPNGAQQTTAAQHQQVLRQILFARGKAALMAPSATSPVAGKNRNTRSNKASPATTAFCAQQQQQSWAPASESGGQQQSQQQFTGSFPSNPPRSQTFPSYMAPFNAQTRNACPPGTQMPQRPQGPPPMTPSQLYPNVIQSTNISYLPTNGGAQFVSQQQHQAGAGSAFAFPSRQSANPTPNAPAHFSVPSASALTPFSPAPKKRSLPPAKVAGKSSPAPTPPKKHCETVGQQQQGAIVGSSNQTPMDLDDAQMYDPYEEQPLTIVEGGQTTMECSQAPSTPTNQAPSQTTSYQAPPTPSYPEAKSTLHLYPSASFKVPSPPKASFKGDALSTQIKKIYHLYRKSLGALSCTPQPSDAQRQTDSWIYARMRDFSAQVGLFRGQVATLLGPKDGGGESTVALEGGACAWLEVLVLRSCWYSLQKYQSLPAYYTFSRGCLYFDPQCIEPIALRPSGETLANSRVLESMLAFGRLLGRLALDEVELALLTAWLLFDEFFYDSTVAQENVDPTTLVPSGSKTATLKALRGAVHELLFEYQNVTKKKAGGPEEAKKTSRYRTMDVLLSLTELTAISVHFGV